MAVRLTGLSAPAALRFANGLLLRLRVRVAPSGLDARLAAGEDPRADAALTRRSAQLVSRRAQRRLASALERVCSQRLGRAAFSAAIPVDASAVQIARPALAQLATRLRSGEAAEVRGVALAHQLLTEGSSALYRPARPDDLYAVAREALLALTPGRPPNRTPQAQ